MRMKMGINMEQVLLQKQGALLMVGCHFSKHIYLGHGEKELEFRLLSKQEMHN